MRGNSRIYSRKPLPPQDYLTATVTSLLREMAGANATDQPDWWEGDSWADAVGDPEAVCAGRRPLGEPARGAFTSAPGVPLSSRSRLTGRIHLYVVDTSHPRHHMFPGWKLETDPRIPPAWRGRSANATDYWFRSFAALRRRYGVLPCVTFLSWGAYTRLVEVGDPDLSRGVPAWHPDNRRKNMQRGLATQTLDFVSGVRHAAAFSPRAHVLVWEDDCHACTGVTALIESADRVLSTVDPRWGALKLGNGGSGMLFHRDIVAGAVPYLVTRRGSENIDVSMWRYVHSGGWSDYVSKKSWSAHRGQQSSFKLGVGPTWGRVKCTNDLDRHWGWYRPCEVSRVEELAWQVENGVVSTPGKGGPGATAAAAGSPGPYRFNASVTLPPSRSPAQRADVPPGSALGSGDGGWSGRYTLHTLARDFACSVYSPASDGQMPPGING
jgi:hypothetical protein